MPYNCVFINLLYIYRILWSQCSLHTHTLTHWQMGEERRKPSEKFMALDAVIVCTLLWLQFAYIFLTNAILLQWFSAATTAATLDWECTASGCFFLRFSLSFSPLLLFVVIALMWGFIFYYTTSDKSHQIIENKININKVESDHSNLIIQKWNSKTTYKKRSSNSKSGLF